MFRVTTILTALAVVSVLSAGTTFAATARAKGTKAEQRADCHKQAAGMMGLKRTVFMNSCRAKIS